MRPAFCFLFFVALGQAWCFKGGATMQALEQSLEPSLLFLSDSIIRQTGFGRVAYRLVTRLAQKFRRIDNWGIFYNGWPVLDIPIPDNVTLYPGGYGEWNSIDRMQQFLTLLQTGDYTHVVILQDHFMFMPPHGPKGFCKSLAKACDVRAGRPHRVRSMFYAPIDADFVLPEWMDVFRHTDIAATYTDYGARIISNECGISPIVIPHGSDKEYAFNSKMKDPAFRSNFYEQNFKLKNVKHDTVVLLNVNNVQKRKAPIHCMAILKRLKEIAPDTDWRLHLHMARRDLECVDLEQAAVQFGLKMGEDWCHSDNFFKNGNAVLNDEQLILTYSAASALLTTTLGEGWGLSITEGAACGLPIFVPDHTACREIVNHIGTSGGALLPLSSTPTVLSMEPGTRLRWPVDVDRAAATIATRARDLELQPKGQLSDEARNWLDWDRIADKMAASLFI
jgi:glycosyltransferase involved in cell wall biosynthesis